MANITISGLTGKTAVATDEIEVQATGGGASNKVTALSLMGVASPTLTTPLLGTPTSGTLTNCTGLPAAGVVGTAAVLGANTFTALQTITQASANAGILASTGGSNTGSNAVSAFDLSWTLNTSGSPDVVAWRITDTARGASTKLFNVYAGASGTTSVLSLDRSGNLLSGAAIFAGTSVRTGGSAGPGVTLDQDRIWMTQSGGTQGFLSAGTSQFSGQDTFLIRGGVATWQSGAANAASPVAQTLQAQGSRSGTDSNVGGANYTIRAGTGTGTGTLSSLILQSPVAVASGSGAQTDTTGLTIKGGQAVLTAYTVATLPTGITGGRAYVTDATAPTYLGALTGGGAVVCPVFYNGSAWVSG